MTLGAGSGNTKKKGKKNEQLTLKVILLNERLFRS